MRRRGIPAAAIRAFCKGVGVNKYNSTIDIQFFEHCVRAELNTIAPRGMAGLDPIKVIITNYPEGQEEELEAINAERTSHIAELESGLAEKKAEQERQTNSLTELKVRIGQISEQRNSLRQQIESLQSQLQHGRDALESAGTELCQCDKQIVQTHREILKTEAGVSELFVENFQGPLLPLQRRCPVRFCIES